MQSVYSRYRDLKKDIRNLAAVDLQRCVRGYLVRSKSEGDLLPASRSRQKGNLTISKPLSTSASQHPAAGSGPAAVSAAQHAAAGEDLYARYKELLTSKRDLKRRLKRFDEDFAEQWGRAPKKADKEVIRPMYQKYHEVKGALDELKAQIEQSHGPLPEDLLDESGGASARGPSGHFARGGSGNIAVDSDSDLLGA